MAHLDLAGCYPINTARRNQYILICYYYDSNVILVEAFPFRSGACINKGVQKLLDILTTAGKYPKIHIMDNEACDLLKKTLFKQKISYQLVPQHTSLRNAAERAIQNFKYQFIASLCSNDPKYLSQEWDRLLSKAPMNLNLLRTSGTNPKISAYATIFGIHDFNRCPLEPPGTKSIVHEKTYNRWS